jgi:hypothetical protein
MCSNVCIEVGLLLSGSEIALDDVIHAIALQPALTWRIGDSVQGTLLKRKEDGLLFSLQKTMSMDLEEVVKQLLDALEPHNDKIRSAMNTYGLQAELSCAIYLTNATPCLNLPVSTLERIVYLRATLDIDLILS